jgi:hypothetical protein
MNGGSIYMESRAGSGEIQYWKRVRGDYRLVRGWHDCIWQVVECQPSVVNKLSVSNMLHFGRRELLSSIGGHLVTVIVRTVRQARRNILWQYMTNAQRIALFFNRNILHFGRRELLLSIAWVVTLEQRIIWASSNIQLEADLIGKECEPTLPSKILFMKFLQIFTHES